MKRHLWDMAVVAGVFVIVWWLTWPLAWLLEGFDTPTELERVKMLAGYGVVLALLHAKRHGTP